ncbi:unnamed protein product, partial [Iphiclides podalirius]
MLCRWRRPARHTLQPHGPPRPSHRPSARRPSPHPSNAHPTAGAGAGGSAPLQHARAPIGALGRGRGKGGGVGLRNDRGDGAHETSAVGSFLPRPLGQFCRKWPREEGCHVAPSSRAPTVAGGGRAHATHKIAGQNELPLRATHSMRTRQAACDITERSLHQRMPAGNIRRPLASYTTRRNNAERSRDVYI